MKSNAHLTVAVLHEDAVVDAGLKALLKQQAEIAVVDADLRSATILITDYRHARRLLEHARAELKTWNGSYASPRILIVADTAREWEVRCALDAGVHGYLVMGFTAQELVDGVRALGQGARHLCQIAMQCIADSLTHDPLTSRETDVLMLLGRGLCNKRIARHLGIAEGTVKAHIKSILCKLGAETRTQAVVIAAERGLLNRHGAMRVHDPSDPFATACALVPDRPLPLRGAQWPGGAASSKFR